MRIEVGLPNLRVLANDLEGDVARAATQAMRETTPEAVAELRQQVVGAGLGNRLANTWRGRVYPDQGRRRHSLEPAGFIWSRAPEIVDSYVRGATIVPLAGRRYLAIPTDNVPKAIGRRGAQRRMTPEQVEVRYNQDLFIQRGKGGRLLAFVSIERGKRRSRRRSRRLADGASRERLLMFVLVPSVRMPKLLDLEAPAQRWTARYEAAFTRLLGANT